ncbi:MAG: hypothetical protein HFF44_06160, partial [Lawsonibacter sp.]|nr:hypothetical protein [Lawsonibacter sp.]
MPRGRKRRNTVADEDIMAHCVNCGTLLTMETGVLATPDWYKETRFVHYCKECQKAQFEDFVDHVGVDMAFYLCCAAYNLPFIPEAVPSRRNVDGETWAMYLENLKMLDQDVTDNGEAAAFSDGMTDLSVIFDGKVPKSPSFAGGLTSGGVAEKLEGTRAQRRNWGLSYKTPEYKELDRLYGIQSKPYEGTGIDDELEYNLREVCKLQLLYSQQIAEGDSKKSKETYSIISKMKADNLMRKSDEAPIAAKKIDTVIAALERNKMAKGGKLLPYEELLPILQADHPHSPMSHDMLDYCQRQYEIVRKRRRNFVVFRRGWVTKSAAALLK